MHSVHTFHALASLRLSMATQNRGLQSNLSTVRAALHGAQHIPLHELVTHIHAIAWAFETATGSLHPRHACARSSNNVLFTVQHALQEASDIVHHLSNDSVKHTRSWMHNTRLRAQRLLQMYDDFTKARGEGTLPSIHVCTFMVDVNHCATSVSRENV